MMEAKTRKIIALALSAVAFFSGAYFLSAGAASPEDSVQETLEEAPAATARYIPAADLLAHSRPNSLATRSDVVLVLDDREGIVLYGRHIDEARPIASLTKLMTGLVIVESGLALDEPLTVTREDRDRLRGSRSRLPFNATFSRHDLLLAALGASDNRAAAALARTYPGGAKAFVAAMNQRAASLGMTRTRFADSSGLDSRNVASARDLARLIEAVRQHELLRALTTTGRFALTDLETGREIAFHNTNRLVRNANWEIGLSKTGYTADAGNCLVMQASIGERPVTIVLLDSWGKLSKYGDAERIRNWLIKTERRVPRLTTAQTSS